jgi:hypothetical protein
MPFTIESADGRVRTMVVGMNIIRAIQVTQLNRDAGHMFARGVDFSTPANQNMLIYLASGLNLTAGGKSVLILSQIIKVDCTSCANRNRAVFMQQLKLGNTSLRASAYGNPIVTSTGAVQDYANASNALTGNFDPAVMAMQPGDIAYVAESYYRSSENDIPGFMTGTGVAARGIF